MKGLTAAVAIVATLVVAVTTPAAGATDECTGLQVCLPAAGPWVVVPAAPAGRTSTVVWQLRCPLPNYIVAGVDARVTDRSLDVSIRGENGAPVSPGVTTGRSVLFVAVYTGAARKPTSFRPFIGCIPTQGGGGRSETSVARTVAFKPGTPTDRRVVTIRLGRGAEKTVVARCPRGSRLLGASHAVGLRIAGEPSRTLLEIARVRRTSSGNAVTAIASVAASAPRALRVELQLHALCTRTVR